MRIYLTVIIMFLLFEANYAQTKKGEITGIVIDSIDETAIPFSSVLLYRDSLTQYGTITDTNGYFSFNKVLNGNYILKVKALSYKDFEKEVKVMGKETGQKIILQPVQYEINDVAIIGNLPEARHRINKDEYFVTDDILKSSKDIFDVLNQTPGIDVGFNKSLTIEGNSNILVLIDNIEVKNNSILTQIPKEEILKIEVINTPSAKYSSLGYSGIINIIRKKNDKQGIYLDLQFSNGIKLNYNESYVNLIYLSDKIRAYTYYSYYLRNYVTEASYIREPTTLTDTLKGIDKIYPQKQIDNELYYGIEYTPSNKNTFGLSGYYSFYSEKFKSVYKDLVNQSQLSNIYSEKMKTFDHNIYYKREMSPDGHKFITDLRWKSISYDDFYELEGINNSTFEVLANNSYANLTMDYSLPVKNSLFETGINLRQQSFSNNSRDQEGKGYNCYRYSYYATYSYDLKIFSNELGLSVAKYDRKFKNGKMITGKWIFLPSITFYKDLNNNNAIRGGYYSNIDYPNMWVMEPNMRVTGINLFSTGNPDLIPETTHFLYCNYIYDNRQTHLSFKPYFELVNNSAETSYSLSNDSIIGSYINLNSQAYGFSSALSFSPIKNLNVSSNIKLFNQYLDGRSKLSYYLGVDIYYPVNTWSFGLNYKYSSWQLVYEGEKKKPDLWFCYLGKSFFNEKLEISLLMLQPFGKYITRVKLNNSVFKENRERTMYVRTFAFIINYKFNVGRKAQKYSPDMLYNEESKH